MKKIITFLLLVLLVPTMVFAEEQKYTSQTLEEALKSEEIKGDLSKYNEGENKVPIYLFRGQGCSHCHEFLEYVASDLVKEYGDKFELISFEVWNNKTNSDLMESVSKYLNDDASGVPYIVIGDKSFNGYAESMNEEIKTAITDLYNAEEKYDILTEMKEHPEAKKQTKKQDSTSVVVFVIFATIAVIALVVNSVKKNS
ncbi:MAG: hypothetical protein IKG27_00805 [Bacilli bacterium]|nr:hypothetical protein [Bacilli bacterium]